MKFIERRKIGFQYLLRCFDETGRCKWVQVLENLIPIPGLNYLISSGLDGGAQYSTWYIGMSETAYAPLAADTMVSLLLAAPECKSYDEGARVAVVPDAVASGLYSNTASPAVFTFNATATVRVVFIASNSVWDSTTGLLLSATQIAVPKAVEDTDILHVTAGLQLTAV